MGSLPDSFIQLGLPWLTSRFFYSAGTPLAEGENSFTDGNQTLDDYSPAIPGTVVQINYETGDIVIEFFTPPEEGVDIVGSVKPDIFIDEPLVHQIRRTLGLFIDETGLGSGEAVTSEEEQLRKEGIIRRITDDLPSFFEISGTKRFVDFLSYAADAGLEVESLWRFLQEYTNQFPFDVPNQGSAKFEGTLFGPLLPLTIRIQYSGGEITDDGFGRLIGDVGDGANTVNYQTGEVAVSFKEIPIGYPTYSYINAEYREFFESLQGARLGEGGTWFKTSHVGLYNDKTRFNADKDQIATLFYQLAPIHLVLEFIGEILYAYFDVHLGASVHLQGEL